MSAFSVEEVAEFRNETPGCRQVVHFNHAGASLMPQVVLDTVVAHLNREALVGGYEAADEQQQTIDAAYDSIVNLLHAKRNEIAIVENATRAWDMAFYAIPFKSGDRILTSKSEYGSNVIAFLQVAKRGVSVEVVPNDEHGQISLTALESMLDDRVKVVAISHTPTNGGLIQPAAAIGKIVRKSDAIYLLDACQTVGQIPIDVEEIGCDILTATSRKYLRGPRGVGFLYVRESLITKLEPPFLDNHAATWTSIDTIEIREDARRFENWESSLANTLGFKVAVDYALELGLERIWATIEQQARRLRESLNAIPGITVRDLGVNPGGIVTFTHDRVDPSTIQKALLQRRINTTTSSIYSTRYDMEDRGLAAVSRASLHYLTTDAEIATLCEAVEAVTRG